MIASWCLLAADVGVEPGQAVFGQCGHEVPYPEWLERPVWWPWQPFQQPETRSTCVCSHSSWSLTVVSNAVNILPKHGWYFMHKELRINLCSQWSDALQGHQLDKCRRSYEWSHTGRLCSGALLPRQQHLLHLSQVSVFQKTCTKSINSLPALEMWMAKLADP